MTFCSLWLVVLSGWLVSLQPPISEEKSFDRPPETYDPEDPRYAGFYRGVVVGPDDKPLVGAKVYLRRTRDEAYGPHRAITDKDGVFEFVAKDMTSLKYDDRPKLHEGMLVACKEGYGVDWFRTWGADGFPTDEWKPVRGAKIRLKLPKANVSLSGQLHAPDGKPLVGAKVSVDQIYMPLGNDLDQHIKRQLADENRGSPPKIYEKGLGQTHLIPGFKSEVTSDADGRFAIPGIGDDRVVLLKVRHELVRHQEVEAMTRQVPAVKHPENCTLYGSEIRPTLKPGFVIRGIVRDQKTKAPIAGMSVEDPLIWRRDRSLSDANGKFTIIGLDPSFANHTSTIIALSGKLYRSGRGTYEKDKELVIECESAMIPYQLRLFHENGTPFLGDADVTYTPTRTNPIAEAIAKETSESLRISAVNRGKGLFEGTVIPGPGVVVVDLHDGRKYRPAYVDIPGFFDPVNRSTTFGTPDLLERPRGSSSLTHREELTSYEAVIPLRLAEDAAPLQLTAKIEPDRPRLVKLEDDSGKPINNVISYMRWPVFRSSELLQEDRFQLRGMHPKRTKIMNFFHEERKLCGRLMAPGDSDDPITVRLQPWAALSGRLLDKDGQPFGNCPLCLISSEDGVLVSSTNLTDENGKFTLTKLFPDVSYQPNEKGDPSFFLSLDGQQIKDLKFKPGENRQLGDILANPKGRPCSNVRWGAIFLMGHDTQKR
ncbi:MAG: carboxypeptidase-like regulatory domain-containing protein [Fimbriiglobus sp.]